MILEELTKGTNLTPLQIRSWARKRSISEGGQISEEDRFSFYVHMLVRRLKFLDLDQQTLLLDSFEPNIHLLFSSAVAGHMSMFVIADGRYATWSGFTGWLDLSSGDTITELSPPFETVAYNLNILWAQNEHAKKSSSG